MVKKISKRALVYMLVLVTFVILCAIRIDYKRDSKLVMNEISYNPISDIALSDVARSSEMYTCTFTQDVQGVITVGLLMTDQENLYLETRLDRPGAQVNLTNYTIRTKNANSAAAS